MRLMRAAGKSRPRLGRRRSALFQREMWWDRQGRAHRLTEMPLSYLLNVLNFLEQRAQRYYLLDRWTSPGYGLHREDVRGQLGDPVSWLHGTPLWRAVSAQAATRVFGDARHAEPNV